MGESSHTETASVRSEIEVLRAEIARADHRTGARIDGLMLVLAGGLFLIIVAMLVGLAIGSAT